MDLVKIKECTSLPVNIKCTWGEFGVLSSQNSSSSPHRQQHQDSSQRRFIESNLSTSMLALKDIKSYLSQSQFEGES